MQDDREHMCTTGLGDSRPPSAPVTDESLESTTLQSERVPHKRKSDEELGSDNYNKRQRSSDTGTVEENGNEEKEICEPSEPERRVIISTYFFSVLRNILNTLDNVKFERQSCTCI